MNFDTNMREWLVALSELTIAISAVVGFAAPRIRSLSDSWISQWHSYKASKLDDYVNAIAEYGWKMSDVLQFVHNNPKISKTL